MPTDEVVRLGTACDAVAADDEALRLGAAGAACDCRVSADRFDVGLLLVTDADADATADVSSSALASGLQTTSTLPTSAAHGRQTTSKHGMQIIPIEKLSLIMRGHG